MYWFVAKDGTRFIVQTPAECARSLALAFSEQGAPVSSPKFIAQLQKECAPAGKAKERASVSEQSVG